MSRLHMYGKQDLLRRRGSVSASFEVTRNRIAVDRQRLQQPELGLPAGQSCRTKLPGIQLTVLFRILTIIDVGFAIFGCVVLVCVCGNVAPSSAFNDWPS